MLIRESPARCGSAAASELFPLSEKKAPAPMRGETPETRHVVAAPAPLPSSRSKNIQISILNNDKIPSVYRLYANVTTWQIRNIENRESLK